MASVLITGFVVPDQQAHTDRILSPLKHSLSVHSGCRLALIIPLRAVGTGSESGKEVEGSGG